MLDDTSRTLFGLLVFLTGLRHCFGDILVVNLDTNHTEEDFIDYELSVAAQVPDDGLKGLLEIASPANGCHAMTPPPWPSNETFRWFALIQRKGCPIEEKILNAEGAGFSAAIIYNVGVNTQFNDGSDLPKDPKIKIPGVVIGYDDGKKLGSEYAYPKNYMIIITPETVFNLSTYLLPFAVVIGVAFLVMLIFMIVKCVKDRRHNMRNRLSSRHLRHLVVNKFKKGDRYEVCAICLEEYCEGEKLRILPCAHAYHTKCIDPWLTKNRRNCPICKRKVAIPGITSDSDDSDSEEVPSERTPLLTSTRSSIENVAGRSNNEPTEQRQSRNSLIVTVAATTSAAPEAEPLIQSDSSQESRELDAPEQETTNQNPQPSVMSYLKSLFLRRRHSADQLTNESRTSTSSSGSYGSIDSLVPVPSGSHSINFDHSSSGDARGGANNNNDHSNNTLPSTSRGGARNLELVV